MGDGRINRAIQQGKARTTDIKTRVPDLRERVPELRERVPELTDELKNRGSELRSKGGELARQYAKMDVSWARCSYAKAARAALLSFGLGPMIDYYVRKRVVGSEVFDTLSHPVVFVANHSSHLDTPTILRAMPRKWRSRTAVAAAADYFYNKRWKANGVALLFNTVPLERKGGGLGNVTLVNLGTAASSLAVADVAFARIRRSDRQRGPRRGIRECRLQRFDCDLHGPRRRRRDRIQRRPSIGATDPILRPARSPAAPAAIP